MRARGFYSRDARGVPDIVQRLHWDESWSQRIGLARPYDYSPQRMINVAHSIIDWMRDDALLHRFCCEIRRFKYVGDLSTIREQVADKREKSVVELERSCTNQRGDTTATASATVYLSTKDGYPQLPTRPKQKWRPYQPMDVE